MTSNHKKFIEHLKKSQEAVWKVAQHLGQRGWSVRVNSPRVAPDASLHASYIDVCDIELAVPIEVKQRHNVSFTCQQDLPGGELIVCAAHSFNHSPPFAYVHLDDDASHAAIIHSGSHEKWEQRRIHDKRYGPQYSQLCYVAKAEDILVVAAEDIGKFIALRLAPEGPADQLPPPADQQE